MKFLKGLGWLVVPYIMIFFQWKKIGAVGKGIGTAWALVVLLIVIGGSNSDDTKPTAPSQAISAPAKPIETPVSATPQPTAQTPAPAPEPAKVFKIGQDVAVGDLVFKVESVNTAKQVGNEFLNKKANAKFQLIKVTVKNNGKEAVTISDSFFKLLEDDGTEYSSDTAAAIYANQDGSFFLEQINPKTAKTGVIVFDIPETAKNLKLQVQTGLFGTEQESIELKK